MPRIRFSSVVLPLPDGPRMETISPSFTVSEIPVQHLGVTERFLYILKFEHLILPSCFSSGSFFRSGIIVPPDAATVLSSVWEKRVKIH